MEAEQEAVLTSLGEELDAACCSLARNGEDKLQVTLFLMLFCFCCCCVCLKLHSATTGQRGFKTHSQKHNAHIQLAC